MFFFFAKIQKKRPKGKSEKEELYKKLDAITRPTIPYEPRDFEMGLQRHPVVCITEFSAQMYCRFLSEKTGHYYRLPTEAEWEYACRAGTTTAYSWGDDTEKIDDYGWYYDNANESYHPVGHKKPNPWGLHDMHGNVAEWCLDQYISDFYKQFETQKKVAMFPVAIPVNLYPRVIRGGSWDDDPEDIRSASRFKSSKDWKGQDPQIPQSMWWNSDSMHVGFRVIRPLRRPTQQEIEKYLLAPNFPKELDRKNWNANMCK